MSTMFKCLLTVFALCVAGVLSAPECAKEVKMPIHQQILANYKHDMKTLFKVWHFIFGKTYDYNTIQGIDRFKIFKQNFKQIEAHNASGKSYTMALNHLSDMTNDEIKAYYNLKPMPISRVSRGLRKLNKFNLDDFNDDDDIPTNKNYVKQLVASDHRAKMKPVRDQKNCGSCWAFTTAAVLEGRFYDVKNKVIEDWVSTQQSVDCDMGNGGCNGGWFSDAFMYFTENEIMLEGKYKYNAKRETCKFNKKNSFGYKITGYVEYDKDYNGDRNVFEVMVNSGPVAVAVDANEEWFKYGGGIFSANCSNQVNHAVTLVGWQPETKCKGAHWIIRNSWGNNWGENGHILIEDNDENSMSCNIERFGYSTKGFEQS